MSQIQPFQTLILAGSRDEETDVVAKISGVPCKALASLAGQSMVERVADVLLDHTQIGPILLSINDQLFWDKYAPSLSEWIKVGGIIQVTPKQSPARSIQSVLGDLQSGESLFVTTADHVLLSQQMLDQFFTRALELEYDACAGVLPIHHLNTKYPHLQRTRLRFRDGGFSGCNLFLFKNNKPVRELLDFWIKLEGLRKSPTRMAFTIGPVILFNYLFKLKTLSQTVERIGHRFNAHLCPVFMDIAEAAIDVDSPQDFEFVEKLLRGQ